jgi:hypothetical protein
MLTLPRDQYDTLEIADNTRRALAKTKAADAATTAFLSYASQVLSRQAGTGHGQALLKLLDQAPAQPLAVCLNALGYVVGEDTTDRTEPLCYVVTAGAGGILHVFADPSDADDYLNSTLGNDVVEAPFEPITTPPTEISPELDLDMLAADIAKAVSDYGYSELGFDVDDDAIRAALVPFIHAALAAQHAKDNR